MKRVLILAALSALAMACSDDDGGDDDKTVVDAGGDAKVDASMDGSTSTAKVTNVGAACTAASQCMGTAPTCETTTPIGGPFPGGYCSAVCSTSAECGATGACPLGELIMLNPTNPMLAGLSGQCWEKCTAVGTTAGCRSGYACTTLGTAIGNSTPIAPLMQPVCLPLVSGDAGLSDASVVDASGIDASN
jgi:hypothetical protein